MRGYLEFDLGDEEIDGNDQLELFQFSDLGDPNGPPDAAQRWARERKARPERFRRRMLAPPGNVAIFESPGDVSSAR